jgi:hypothetical protein
MRTRRRDGPRILRRTCDQPGSRADTRGTVRSVSQKARSPTRCRDLSPAARTTSNTGVARRVPRRWRIHLARASGTRSPEGVRGRADLRGAADRPVGILRTQRGTAIPITGLRRRGGTSGCAHASVACGGRTVRSTVSGESVSSSRAKAGRRPLYPVTRPAGRVREGIP